MDEKTKQPYQKYPILLFLLPITAGIIVWIILKDLWMVAFIVIGGFIMNGINWYILKQKSKK